MAHGGDVVLLLHPPELSAVVDSAKKLLAVTDVPAFHGRGAERGAHALLIPKLSAERVAALRHLVDQHNCDLFISSSTYYTTQRRLDMDSCLLANECIDEMAYVYGKGPEVAEITRKAMHDGTPFDEALRLRVALLKGMSREQLQSVWGRLELNPGAARLIAVLKAAGVTTAVVSGGFTVFACRVAQLLGCDYAFSNTLLFDEAGRLTGEVTAPIVNGQVKEQVLRALGHRHGLRREELVAIGDGANDRWMVAHAGLGVAFHAKKLLKEATPHHINHSSLDALAFYMNQHSTGPVPSPSLRELLSRPSAADAPAFMPLHQLIASSDSHHSHTK